MNSNLSHLITLTWRAALQHRLSVPALPLSAVACQWIRSVWQRLVREGSRLIPGVGPLAQSSHMLKHLTWELTEAISAALQGASQLACVIPVSTCPTSSSGPTVPSKLNFASGNPGKTGCVSLDGCTVLWHRIYGQQWSAITAMKELGLDLLGLPAARPTQ